MGAASLEREHEMPGHIIHIPPVFMQKPSDPREQDVTDEATYPTEVDAETIHLHRTPSAVRPLAGDVCSACGLLTTLHQGTAGTWLGCNVAKFSDLGSRRRPVEPSRWNDPYAEITAAVRAAMVDGSVSARLEIDMAHYSNDEQLNIAAAVVRVAISTYIAQLAQRDRR